MARTRFAFFVAVNLALVSATGLAAVPSLLQPSWSELKPEQRQILAPLATDWDSLDQARRSKWLGIAQRYPSMSADEQARVQRRMQAWAKLTPDERKQARQKFLSLQNAPEKKEAVKQKWQEYKQLPDSEKTRLKQEATKNPQPRPAASKAVPLSRPAVTPASSGKSAATTPQSTTPVPPVLPAKTEPPLIPAGTMSPPTIAPATLPATDSSPAR